MIEMLVDIRDHDPIGDAPALVPAFVVILLGRENVRVGISAIEVDKRDLWVSLEIFASAVIRPIVGDEEAIDPRLVVPEEEIQQGEVIPAESVKMNLHRLA